MLQTVYNYTACEICNKTRGHTLDYMHIKADTFLQVSQVIILSTHKTHFQQTDFKHGDFSARQPQTVNDSK